MNPYNIGDRVWTPKRGWGVVKSHNKENTGHRPFSIAFDEDFEGYSVVLRNPKLQNVFSEAQKKALDELAQENGVEQFWETLNDSIDATFEAIRKQLSPSIFEPKFKAGDMVEHTSGWVRKVSGYYYDLLNGGFQYRFDSLRGVSIRESELKSWVKHGLATDDPVRPIFKVGDAVYFDHGAHSKKWEIVGFRIGDMCEPDTVTIQNTKQPAFHVELLRSYIRTWKETVITHDDALDPVSAPVQLSDLCNPKHIGTHISGKDIFTEDAGKGKIVIWYGIKGDDIS